MSLIPNSPDPQTSRRVSRAASAALFLVSLAGCTPGEALDAITGLGLAFLGLLAFAVA